MSQIASPILKSIGDGGLYTIFAGLLALSSLGIIFVARKSLVMDLGRPSESQLISQIEARVYEHQETNGPFQGADQRPPPRITTMTLMRSVHNHFLHPRRPTVPTAQLSRATRLWNQRHHRQPPDRQTQPDQRHASSLYLTFLLSLVSNRLYASRS